MGVHSNYSKSMYNQMEELLNRIDKLLQEIKHLRLELELQKSLNMEKDKKLEELTEKLNIALEELDKERSKNNKNSNNSSKPSSTSIVTPKKEKTGANQYNYRTKSGKLQGGQIGHEGKSYSKERLEREIKDNKLKVVTIKHIIGGNSKKEPLVKYQIGLEINPIVYKHIFTYSEDSKEKLPKEFQTDVTYHTSIKSMAINLDTQNVVSLDRQTDFFNAVTNGFLNIGKGTLMNFKVEFSKKAKPTLNNIESNLMRERIMQTDESSSKFNGKNIYVRNYSNILNVLYKMHEHKGHDPIKEDNILINYLGGIMGDHDTTLYSYGTKNYECNIHVGRYLQEIIELAPNVRWADDMKTLLFRMKNSREIAMAYGAKSFSTDKINEYNKEYNDILESAKEEDKKIPSKTFRGKAEKLRRRLLKYKLNHLYFIYDFDVPFDNNLSESDIRVFKIKTKVSGGFRSLGGAQLFADALSIVKTAKKRKMNPMVAIESIFKNLVLFN